MDMVSKQLKSMDLVQCHDLQTRKTKNAGYDKGKLDSIFVSKNFIVGSSNYLDIDMSDHMFISVDLIMKLDCPLRKVNRRRQIPIKKIRDLLM